MADVHKRSHMLKETCLSMYDHFVDTRCSEFRAYLKVLEKFLEKNSYFMRKSWEYNKRYNL